MTDRFLTVRELANRWNISPQTLYNHHSQGSLPIATKIFGALRFAESAILEYEEKSKAKVRD